MPNIVLQIKPFWCSWQQSSEAAWSSVTSCSPTKLYPDGLNLNESLMDMLAQPSFLHGFHVIFLKCHCFFVQTGLRKTLWLLLLWASGEWLQMVWLLPSSWKVLPFMWCVSMCAIKCSQFITSLKSKWIVLSISLM